MKWIRLPISPTCEVRTVKDACGMPTTHAYKAWRGGWMALCEDHAHKHLDIAKPPAELLEHGETLKQS